MVDCARTFSNRCCYTPESAGVRRGVDERCIIFSRLTITSQIDVTALSHKNTIFLDADPFVFRARKFNSSDHSNILRFHAATFSLSCERHRCGFTDEYTCQRDPLIRSMASKQLRLVPSINRSWHWSEREPFGTDD